MPTQARSASDGSRQRPSLALRTGTGEICVAAALRMASCLAALWGALFGSHYRVAGGRSLGQALWLTALLGCIGLGLNRLFQDRTGILPADQCIVRIMAIACLIVFLFFLVRIGASAVFALASFCWAGRIVHLIGQEHSSVSPLLLPLTLLLVAGCGLSLSWGAHRRTGSGSVVLIALGLLAGVFTHLQPGYLPITAAILVAYTGFAAHDRMGGFGRPRWLLAGLILVPLLALPLGLPRGEDAPPNWNPRQLAEVYRARLRHAGASVWPLFLNDPARMGGRQGKMARLIGAPWRLLPDGTTYLAFLVVLAAGGVVSVRFLNLGTAFALTALATAAAVLQLESALLSPGFQLAQHGYFLFCLLCAGLLTYQLAAGSILWLIGVVADRLGVSLSSVTSGPVSDRNSGCSLP